MASIETIATTLHGLAAPGMTRKDLIATVREHHPEASKKDVVRAAFYALTSGMDGDAERARRLHDLALAERTADEAEVPPADRPRRKRKRDRAGGAR